jgi:hypothetical protein
LENNKGLKMKNYTIQECIEHCKDLEVYSGADDEYTENIILHLENTKRKKNPLEALVMEKIAKEMLGYCSNANNWRVEELEMEYNNNLPDVTVEFKLIKLEDAMKIIDSNFTA